MNPKKLRFVFVKFRLLKNSTFKFFTVPFVIKSLNTPSSSKNISILIINFPSFILLFKKLLKFEGFIRLDKLFN